MWVVILLVTLIFLTILYNSEDKDNYIPSDYTYDGVNPYRTVISTTTTPNRLKYIQTIIDNMYSQTYHADNMYINIPYVFLRDGQEYDSNFLNTIDTKNNWVKIVRCEDQGPATKLLGCLSSEKDPDTIIITVDDDQLYRKGLLSILIKYAIQYPEAVLATETMDVFMRYISGQEELCKDPIKTMYIAGFGGVAYRRKFWSDWDIEFIKNIPKSCVVSDDLVFSTLLAFKDIPRYHIQSFNTRIDNVEIDKISPLRLAHRDEVYSECYGFLAEVFRKVKPIIYIDTDNRHEKTIKNINENFEIKNIKNNNFNGWYIGKNIIPKKTLFILQVLYPGKDKYIFEDNHGNITDQIYGQTGISDHNSIKVPKEVTMFMFDFQN